MKLSETDSVNSFNLEENLEYPKYDESKETI